MAWVRSREPVLAKIRLTCVLTVADEKRARDLPVGPARRDQAQHLRLAWGQVALLLVARWQGWRADGGGQQPLLHLRIKDRLAGRGGQHGPADLSPAGVLSQVAERAGLQGADDRLVIGVGGQHHHLGLGLAGPDAPRRFDPVAARHVQIHENDLGLYRRGELGRGLAVGGLADYGDSRQGAEQQNQTLADGGLVVRDDDGDRLGASRHAGILRATCQFPAVGPASNVPPASAARSVRPVRP
jgi:hypothetical protein